MAGTRTQAEVRCPACQAVIIVPITTRIIGRSEAVAAFDFSAVHAHIAEHDTDD